MTVFGPMLAAWGQTSPKTPTVTSLLLLLALLAWPWPTLANPVMHAVLPQVLPELTDVTIYRWEYHFRASAVLGIVGAGGIGFELIAALRLLNYDQVSAILLSILACVVMVDSVGAYLRKSLK